MPRRRLRDLSIIQNPPNLGEKNSEQQTTIGSSNVPNIADKPVEIQTESGGRRKTRGHTLLKDLYDLKFVERVKVARNSNGQPIGSETRLLAGYLGIITRNANLLPISYESWHHMFDSNKNQTLDNIKERFALEVSDNYVKKTLGKKGRDHKSTLKKKYFKKNISLEEKLRNVPLEMLRCQWEETIKLWNSKKGEELSSGQKVGPLQLFDITYRKKDGSLMTTEAAEIMEKLRDKSAKYEAITSSDSSVNLDDIDNRIITEVLALERYSRVRFEGYFVNPTQYFGSSSQQYMPSTNQAQAKVQRLRDQMAQRQASTVEQIAQLKAEAASREADAQRKYDEL